MNGGKFDGGALTDEQKQLRQFYADLLNLASGNPAIASGDYFDITKFNVDKGNCPSLVHAFTRISGEEKLLIVSNFNSTPEKIKLQLPDAVVKGMRFETGTKYIGRDLLRSGTDIGFDNFSTEIELTPYSAFIFKIKS